MKNRHSRALRWELQSAGAPANEINSLAAIAERIRELPRQPVVSHKPGWLRLAPFGASLAACLIIGAWLVIASQAVLPGSPLFPVQKLSDNAAITIHPAYRGTIMMKRAQQIKVLVANRAPDRRVLAAVADYRSVASAYSFTSANYDVLEFCKTNLSQAARTASGPEQKALTAALDALPSA